MKKRFLYLLCVLSLSLCMNCANKDKEVVCRLTEENGESEGREQGLKDGKNGLAYKYGYNEMHQFHASSENENAELQKYRSRGYKRGYDMGYKEGQAQYEKSQPKVDAYSQRVEQFARNQSGVVASYTDDRYCVYYSKKTAYGHKKLFRYDAIKDKTEEVKLPIQATNGYTSLWLTQNNRYIFIAAEERYTDFIKIDTETRQIKYITDCYSVERSPSGFVVTKVRCINEGTAQFSAEMEYAYTDYYYDEEGNLQGHRDEYR